MGICVISHLSVIHMKQLRLYFDDAVYDRLVGIKSVFRLTWAELLRQGAEALIERELKKGDDA